MDNFKSYEIEYVIESFVGTLLFFQISLSLGAIVWWKVYHKGLKS